MNVTDIIADTNSENKKMGVSSSESSERPGTYALNISVGLEAEMSSIAECHRWDVSFILLTVFQELLRRFTNQSIVVTRLQRMNEGSADLVLSEKLSFQQAVEQNAYAAANRTDKPPALFVDGQLSFATDEHFLDAPEVTSLRSAIHISFRKSKGEIKGFVQYDARLWDPPLIKSFASTYQSLLRSALSDLDTSIDLLSALTDSDLQTIDAWNNTRRELSKLSVSELFTKQVNATPNGIALRCEGKILTYRELADEVSALTAHLKALHVGSGVLVGVCMDRTKDLVVALLAIFQAGGAYLPLDPAFPTERIAFMQEDSQPLVIISQSHLSAQYKFISRHVLLLDTHDWKTVPVADGYTELYSSSQQGGEDLAYVLYTSGSTGKPKGVQITKRSLTNLLIGVAQDLGLDGSDIFLATSSVSFDISAFELFAPLITGGELVVASRAVATNGILLAEAIRTINATVLQATPSGWRVLLEAGWDGHSGLKMLTAGEPLDRTLAHRLLDRGASLWNLYGPTEATIYATGKRIYGQDTKITIGSPLANYTAYILDRNSTRLPIGAVGELYLGGVGIACGYLNREELTNDRFVPNPFSGDDGDRLYRTGDLARFLPDGQIELLGRADNQVKLRGYRIELEEIEALFDSHPSVRKSIAKIIDDGEGDQRLVAYIAPHKPGQIAEEDLREQASRHLPPYMVPGLFIPVEQFALTPGGKIDRKALPLPSAGRPSKVEAISETPSEDLQSVVLNCWRSVLKCPSLDLDQNFFSVGGHSLLAARMFVELYAKLKCKLPVSILLEAPTVRSFVSMIEKVRTSRIKCSVCMQPEGSLPPLYLIHHLLGDILIYRTLANCFAPDRPVFGIQPPPDLVKRPRPFSLPGLATEYVNEIRSQHKGGPIHLAGFSSGSVMAFEMARQLVALGYEVGLLALIDGDIQHNEPDMPHSHKATKLVLRKMAKIVFKMRDELSEGIIQFVAKRLRYLHLLWKMKKLENSEVHTEELTTEQALLLAERSYTPGIYAGAGLLIRFHDEAWTFGPDPMMGWQGLIAGGIETMDFPGGHITGMSPAGAPRLAASLRSQMEEIEAAVQRQLRSERAFADSRITDRILAL